MLLKDLLRSFRPGGSERLRIAASETDALWGDRSPQAACRGGCRSLGASGRAAYRGGGVSSLTVELAEGAQLDLTELFTAEAFAEVSVSQAARSRCRMTTVELLRAPTPPIGLSCRAPMPRMISAVSFSPPARALRAETAYGAHFAGLPQRLLGQGRCRRRGRGRVPRFGLRGPDAQRTDARQQSRNVLLSDGRGSRRSPSWRSTPTT